MDYKRIKSEDSKRITLFDGKGNKVEIIDFPPESMFPGRVYFQAQDLDLLFNNYKENNGLYYACEVILDNIRGGRDLILRMDKTVHNRAIPDDIFVIERLPGFDMVYME